MTIYKRQQRYLTTEKGKASNRKSTAKYAQTDAGRESKRLRNQRYFASEHGKAVNRAKVAKYKAAKLQRIPPWVDRDHLKEIREFYKNCPKGYEVDHVIPLQGDTVSGLHMMANLQYLTAEENGRKSNSWQ
tara:strand:+ start:161 stop:553 length:393 start_codon:yes stop_codon:yes gene_type:complete